MKNEKKLKEYETVWTCDFCGEEFKTKKESDKHELTCEKNQTKPNLLWIFIALLGIYFFTYFISNSYAQSNGLPIRDLLQPQKWFSSEVEKVITPIPTPTLEISPTPTLKPKIKVTTNTNNAGSQINCIGPDGKQFKTTEAECKKFNESWGNKSATNNNTNTNNTNYPPCTIYYPALKYSQTYNYLSPEECIKQKNASNSTSSTTSSITCIVNYPCTGKSYTYQVDQDTCNFMQSGAASTCSTAKAIEEMNNIAHPTIVYPQANPIDGSIHIDSTPTPVVPYGYSN